MSGVPSVGRIVHYVSYGTPGGEYTSQCRAAIVTAVHGRATGPDIPGDSTAWSASLAVLNPEGMFFNRGCVQNEDSHAGGTWHWPERAEASLSAPECMCTPAGECGKCWEKRQRTGDGA